MLKVVPTAVARARGGPVQSCSIPSNPPPHHPSIHPFIHRHPSMIHPIHPSIGLPLPPIPRRHVGTKVLGGAQGPPASACCCLQRPEGCRSGGSCWATALELERPACRVSAAATSPHSAAQRPLQAYDLPDDYVWIARLPHTPRCDAVLVPPLSSLSLPLVRPIARALMAPRASHAGRGRGDRRTGTHVGGERQLRMVLGSPASGRCSPQCSLPLPPSHLISHRALVRRLSGRHNYKSKLHAFGLACRHDQQQQQRPDQVDYDASPVGTLQTAGAVRRVGQRLSVAHLPRNPSRSSSSSPAEDGGQSNGPPPPSTHGRSSVSSTALQPP